jgi:D-alanyl-D-alanine carboxypeptidase
MHAHPSDPRKAAMLRRRSIRIAFSLAAAVATVLVLLAPAPASAATVHLTASASVATYGDDVTLSGTVEGNGDCALGRTARLRWSASDADGFSLLAEAPVDATGGYAFEVSPTVNTRYRVTLPATPDCTTEASNEVSIGVRALVDASVVVADSQVGDCVDVTAIVTPAKPGQTVGLEHKTGGAWTTVTTAALNGDSQARLHPCLGWDDLGVARFRVRWDPQDDLNETSTSAPLAFEVTEARWMHRIDDIVGRRAVSVSVGQDGSYLYRHLDQADRAPASNEKLMLSMALLDTFGPEYRIGTIVSAQDLEGSVVHGDLWILGRGDPIVSKAALAQLAAAIASAGIERVEGHVMGATNYFSQDWNAHGWNNEARDYVNRPTALTFQGNHVDHAEQAAAAMLTKLLEQRDIAVRGRADDGTPPNHLTPIATLQSKPLTTILVKMLRPSWNFAAEVLGKGLGVETRGTPGTIAKGAAAIQDWVRDHGAADFRLYDSSGLSYADRVDAAGMIQLLWAAEAADWGDELRDALPTGGQGTLKDRLKSVRVRAKTGTLTGISALSGWVWADHLDAWVEFSILSDVAKPAAADIEDQIVRVLQNNVG